MKKWQGILLNIIIICGCLIIVFAMIVPIWGYSLMAIPYADDFSYASNTREAAEKYGSIFVAIFARVWYEYLTFVGGMFKVFCMGIGSVPLLKWGILGHKPIF